MIGCKDETTGNDEFEVPRWPPRKLFTTKRATRLIIIENKEDCSKYKKLSFCIRGYITEQLKRYFVVLKCVVSDCICFFFPRTINSKLASDDCFTAFLTLPVNYYQFPSTLTKFDRVTSRLFFV